MTYKVKLVSDEFGIQEFEYDSYEEQLAGALRLVTAARLEYAKDGIFRDVCIGIGEEPEYPELETELENKELTTNADL